MKVAIVQFAPLPPAPSPSPDDADQQPLPSEYNLRRAHDFARQAAAQGADLVCFPEYFLSGVVADRSHWHLAQYPHTHAHLASSASHAQATHWLSTFQSLARELRVDIQVGTIVERAVDEGGRELEREVEVVDDETGESRTEKRPVLENVATYVDWDGNVVGRYKKRNLWWPEKEYLCEGTDEHQVFDTRFGKVGMLVCWDLAWSRSFTPLVLQSAALILAPTYWTALDAGPEGLRHNPRSEEEYLQALIRTRASENECALVFTNVGAPASWSPGDPVGNEEGRIGGSGVCVPFKGKIASAKGPQEELLLVDVDLSILEDARKVYGVRRDLIHKLKQRKELPDWVVE
ncbi:hypothetical protein Rhopal_005376-T1 [Rhodotorula paludigena]|uniref:CN hydrolase domain-containing protein n=1 Tax=Rhodotorula paludigena TaxID=86838 RepID=A0AAV5GIB3_9BASI|nr:hypothetical protein Rhopal_005376-T1 [Rhodotorula paludigena]